MALEAATKKDNVYRVKSVQIIDEDEIYSQSIEHHKDLCTRSIIKSGFQSIKLRNQYRKLNVSII